MQHRLNALFAGQLRDGGRARDKHAPGKQPRRGRQRAQDERLPAKRGQQLVAAEPHTKAGSHNDAAGTAERRVQVDGKDIGAAQKRLQKRQVLFAHGGQQALLVHQRREGGGVGRAGGLKVADLVDHDPLPRRLRAAPQRRDAERKKALRQRAHAVFGAGQGRVKAADRHFGPGGGFPQQDRPARFGAGHKDRGRGRQHGGQRRQQRAFARAAPAGQQQVALTAVAERIPDTGGGWPPRRRRGSVHMCPATPSLAVSGGCRRRRGRPRRAR